jgi:hypothetical protein
MVQKVCHRIPAIPSKRIPMHRRAFTDNNIQENFLHSAAHLQTRNCRFQANFETRNSHQINYMTQFTKHSREVELDVING